MDGVRFPSDARACRPVSPARLLNLRATWILIFGLAIALSPLARSQSPAAKIPKTSTAPSPLQAPGGKPVNDSPPRPDSHRAKGAFQAGVRAQKAGDWQSAYDEFSEAAAYAPATQEFAFLREHARFELVQSHTDDAEREVLAGRTDQARQELERALELDPGYSVARERLAGLTSNALSVVPQTGPRPAGPPRLQTRPGKFEFDVRGPTRTAYAELAQKFGVTAAFDTDLPDRSIRFRTPAIDFNTGLDVLARLTKTFTRIVDAHTFFVAEDTFAKRREYQQEIVRGFVLPASATPDDMNETVRVVRDVTGITHTQLNAGTHILEVRDTPENVALAQAVIEQIEQPRGEMMLEVDLLEVDRDAAHQLGIIPPTSARTFTLSLSEIRQLQAAQNTGTLLQVLQSIFGSGSALGGSSSSLLSAIPPLLIFGGGKTIFLATLPNASANFADTLSVVHSAQRILLRAEDDKAATFFVGERYPITLALLSANLTVPSTTFSPGLIPGLFPRRDFATGNSPVAVATGDFTQDGHQDLVVANQADGTISILLGNGDGSFRPKTDFAVGTSPSAVAVADFNGDGLLDVAVANSSDNDVAILLGKGDGTFQAPVTYPTGNMPVAIATGDFNGDGHTDLAVVNQTDGTVSILLGNGDGTFGAKKDFPVGATPVAITTADFNADGRTDLAVANHGDNTISILLGNGDGTFASAIDYVTGNAPNGIAAADFNRDGRPDLAVTNGTDNTVSIFLGNGDGTFSTRTDFAAGSGPRGIVAADFNGDAVPDLVIVDESGDQVTVLIGNGNGTFTVPVNLPTGNGPVAVAAADFNGDGLLDIAVANEASNSVTVTLNSASVSVPSAPNALQTAYPGSEYEDLGLKVHATPHLHGEDEVTLQLQFEIKALAGSSVNGIPVLSDRTIEQTVRLKQNQTSVLTGIIQSNESRALSGWPGAAEIPHIGNLFGQQNNSKNDTELIIAITPRELRRPPMAGRTIYAGRSTRTTGQP